jgi:LacI family transcriptional regulator
VRPRSSQPKLADVAREAGVSLATASRSLNGTRNVNEEHRRRVLEAVARLGYTPDASAQAVARGSSSSIVLLVSDIADPFFAMIAAGAMREADLLGRFVLLAATGRDPDREIGIVRSMRAQRPQAMLLAGSRPASDPQRDGLIDELRSFELDGGRVVTIGAGDLPFDAIEADDAAAAGELARHMLEQGFRAPLVLTGPPGLASADRRAGGVLRVYQEHGLDVPATRLRSGAFDREGGRGAVEAALRDRVAFDAVIAVNDLMAIGALAALDAAGRCVPEGVGVAGFDDIPQASDAAPPLTTVRIPLVEAGSLAVRRALLGVDVSPLDLRVIARASSTRR